MQIKKLLFPSLIALTLAGCSENGFWFRSGSTYDHVPEKGLYYIGQPYRIRGVLYTPAENMSYSEKGMATWYSRDSQNLLTTNGEVFDDDKMTAAHKTLPLPSLVRITNLENGNTAIVRVNDRGPAVNNRLIDVSRKTAEALEMPETGTVMVQVDILPEESRRLRDELDKYVDSQPTKTELSPDPNTPLYQPQDNSGVELYSGESESITVTDLAPVAPVPVMAVQAPVVEAPQQPIKAQADPVKTQTAEPQQKQQPEKPSVVPVGSWRIQAGAFGQQANVDKAVQKLQQVASVSVQKTGNLTKVFVGPFKDKAEAQRLLQQVKQLGYKDAWVQTIK